MAGAVRELVTKVTFKVDNASLNRTKEAIENLKRSLQNVGGGLDSSLNNSLNSVRRNITQVSMSIRNLRRQMQGLGNISVNPPQGNHGGGNIHTPQNSSTAGLLNAIRNLRVGHADRVYIKGNIQGRNGNGGGSGGDNSPSPHNPTGGGGGRLRNFTDHSGNMLAAGAALTAPIIFPVQEAMKFESAMANVKKFVDFESTEDFNAMGKAIQNMSMKIPMAQEELAAIVASGGQAGIEKANLLDFAESAAKMGVAFDIPADKAGDMMAQWRTAFGMGQSEVVDLADKVNYLGNTTAAAAPLISDVVSRIGPLGEVAGLSSGEIAALGASVVATGTAPEVAATSIKNLMNALGRGENATKGQAEALQKLGFDSVELAKRLKTEGAPVVVEFLKSLEKLEGYEVNSVLGSIVGEEGKAPIASLTGKNLSKLEGNLNAVSDTNKGEWGGSMEAEFNARAATTENSLQLLENSFSVLMANIGVALLPVIQSLATALVPVLQTISEFVQNNQELVGTILTIAAAVGGLLAVFGTIGILISGLSGLAPMFGAIGGAISGIGGIATTIFGVISSLFSGGLTGIITRVLALFSSISGAITGLFSGGITGLISTIATGLGGIVAAAGPVIAVFAAIASVIYYVYQHWDELKAYFASSMPQIQSAVDSLKQAWQNLQPAIQAILPIIAAIAEFIGGVLVGVIKVLWDIGVAAFGAIASAAEIVTSVIGGIVGAIQTAIQWFENLISSADNAANRSANAAAVARGNQYTTNRQTNTFNVNSVADAQALVATNNRDFYATK